MALVIFFGDKEIRIVNHDSRSEWKSSESSVCMNTRDDWDRMSFISKLHDPKIKQLQLLGDAEANVLQLLMSNFIVITAAGGIVTDNQGRMLFIFRRNKWDLPKGKIEENEGIIEGARREIQEETGIEQLVAHHQITTTYHLYEINGAMILKPSHWFYFSTENPNHTKPQTEEEITEVKWFDRDSIGIPLANTYENISMVVNTFLRLS
jgi:ADP-ribose pyrophosphatase YjhB (NUDIX family)